MVSSPQTQNGWPRMAKLVDIRSKYMFLSGPSMLLNIIEPDINLLNGFLRPLLGEQFLKISFSLQKLSKTWANDQEKWEANLNQIITYKEGQLGPDNNTWYVCEHTSISTYICIYTYIVFSYVLLVWQVRVISKVRVSVASCQVGVHHGKGNLETRSWWQQFFRNAAGVGPKPTQGQTLNG